MGRTESINEVKRDMNSLCNVQKIEQVKPKMMFLVFFYNVVLLAFFCYCNNADLELYQNTWRLTETETTWNFQNFKKFVTKDFVVIVELTVDGN